MIQKHRYSISFLLTTLFYLLFIAVYIYYQTEHHISDQKPQEMTVQLSLATFIAEEPTPITEPEEKEEPVVKEEPLVEKKPTVEEKPIITPKPIVEKQPLPKKQIEKPLKTPKPIVKKVKKKKPVVKKKVIKKRVARQVTQGVKRAGTSRNTKAKRDKFFSKVRQNINRHKRYPKIAKRRGIQGKVKVAFTILSNGNVSNIKVTGPKVFHSSARYAIKSAFPISTKNVPISLPKKVNLTLRYQLR